MNVNDWLEEIKDAKKREKDFREKGEDIVDIYEGEKEVPFNVLYSNTETLLPAMFSNIPRPVVQRRFKDEDPVGKYAAQASQRILEYLIDRDIDEYDRFDEAMTDVTLDGLLPGRGVMCIKYDADIKEEELENGTVASDVTSETICPDTKVWDRVYFGYAKKWSKVPWIAYEEYIDEEEAKERYEDITGIEFTVGEEDEENENKGQSKTALIYQIWDKSTRTVIDICPQVKEKPLNVIEDPLGLTGFFNTPKPMQFVRKTGSMIPTALYTLYQNQAKELNRIQVRLNKVIEAIKVRGAYNGALGDDLEKILDEDDNGLVPTDNASMLADGGLAKNIWMLPIGEVIAVAQQLYQARESCKRVIYEITGISDIVRGQSMASETLGAQKIKETWGTMRLKRMQKEAQRYALDSMRIMLEIASSKFSPETWKKMTGMPLPLQEEKDRAKEMMQMAQGIKPEEAPPEIKKAMAIAQLPSWEEILEVLNDNYWRSYRLDIETNSTLDVEATEDKQLVGEFMNAFAQFVNGVAPMVEKGSMDFEVAKSMMLAVVKRFRFGREVEEQLKSMTPPKPQQNPEMEKKAKELQKAEETFTQERQKAGEELDKRFNDLNMEKAQFDFEKKLTAIEQKHKEDLAKAKQDSNQEIFMAEIDKMFEKQKAGIQSMIDKNIARIEKGASNASV